MGHIVPVIAVAFATAIPITLKTAWVRRITAGRCGSQRRRTEADAMTGLILYFAGVVNKP
ncbi:hypothetical protein HRbin17_01932 [bacterium HR17]|uniref:Uncharacterized protein n=1 Tax=Candidatus Fervidibacter japonicus TaxID=2035412 RepID=A0A2H5XDZ4_9BACT|nr:hypothetical protein HRbin17_01932 [bacterium HR17]